MSRWKRTCLEGGWVTDFTRRSLKTAAPLRASSGPCLAGVFSECDLTVQPTYMLHTRHIQINRGSAVPNSDYSCVEPNSLESTRSAENSKLWTEIYRGNGVTSGMTENRKGLTDHSLNFIAILSAQHLVTWPYLLLNRYLFKVGAADDTQSMACVWSSGGAMEAILELDHLQG